MTQPHKFISKNPSFEIDSLWSHDHKIPYDKRLENAGYFAREGIKWTGVEGPYNLPTDLEIPHDNNYLQFQFSQSNLYKVDTTWYTYVLEGVDKKWSALTSNPYSDNYINLQPGKYTFKVSSRNAMGTFTEPAVFSFTILPPWYKTWWSYTLMFLVAAGCLRGYILYRSSKLKQENKILEEKINQRTIELQKSIEDLKATQSQLIQSEKMASLGELTAGIAHEIQNPLNFVNNFSEVNKELISELKENLENGNISEAKILANDIEKNELKITHHGKRADSIVKGMLQHSRNNNGVKEPTDINALADEYFRLAYHGLRAQNKSFTSKMNNNYDPSLGPVNIVPQDIGRVILNLITNAFYAVTEKLNSDKNGFDPTVTVSTKKLYARPGDPFGQDKVEIRVTDNGKGIPKKVIDKIFQPFFTTKTHRRRNRPRLITQL
jgi:signal transduction histidine kinase